MNKILNVIRYVLTIISLIVFLYFGFNTMQNFFDFFAIILIFIFLFFTTFIDIFKKRVFSLRHNIIIIFALVIFLIITFRPILDAYFLVTNSDFIKYNLLTYMKVLYFNNKIFFDILFLIILILNYVDYKIEK